MSNDEDPADAETRGDEASEGRRRFPRMIHREHGEDDERLAERLAHQWATIRAADRRPVPEPIATGPSNFSRAQVPWGVDLAAAWAWRFLVIAAAGYLIARVLGFFAVITLPIVVALLISALVSPLVDRMVSIRLPRAVASILVVLGGIAFVAALLTFAGQQVAERRERPRRPDRQGSRRDPELAPRRPAQRERLADQRLHRARPEGDQRTVRRTAGHSAR